MFTSKLLVLKAASTHCERAAAWLLALVDERHMASLRRHPDAGNRGDSPSGVVMDQGAAEL